MSTALIGRIQEHYSSKNPFVIYRKPGEIKLHLIVQAGSDLNYLEDYSQKGFILAPFQSDVRPIIIYPDQLQDFDHIMEEPETNLLSEKVLGETISKKEYIALVSKAVETIKNGKLKKVVVSRKISFPLTELPIYTFYKLLAKHTNAFCYLWYHPAVGIWLGASPELLLSINGNYLKTFSLAGTMVNTYGSEPDWGIKEIEEQQYVTNYILDQLSNISIHAATGPAQSIRAGSLWHLKSEITARLNNHSLENIIQSLHPTPAVCGLPKDEAMRFIAECEDYNRQFYTGYLGELNLNESGSADLFVNLRCMQWLDQRANIFVGGGITGLSNPEDEWKETQQKSRTIVEALFNS